MGSSKNILMAFMLITAFSTPAFSMDDEYSSTERFIKNAMKIGTVVEMTRCPGCSGYPTAWSFEGRIVRTRPSHSCISEGYMDAMKWEKQLTKMTKKMELRDKEDKERMKMLYLRETYEEETPVFKTPVFTFDFKNDIPPLTASIIKDTPLFTAGIINSASLVFDQVPDSSFKAPDSSFSLVFDQIPDSSFNQVFSGVGTLTKDPAGTLILTGNHSYIDLPSIEANDYSSTAQDSVNDRKEDKE